MKKGMRSAKQKGGVLSTAGQARSENQIGERRLRPGGGTGGTRQARGRATRRTPSPPAAGQAQDSKNGARRAGAGAQGIKHLRCGGRGTGSYGGAQRVRQQARLPGRYDGSCSTSA